MAYHHGLQNDYWDFCDRCGFPHPKSLLAIQKGRRLCSCHNCYDNRDVEFRQIVIGQVLAEEPQQRQPKLEEQSADDMLIF